MNPESALDLSIYFFFYIKKWLRNRSVCDVGDFNATTNNSATSDIARDIEFTLKRKSTEQEAKTPKAKRKPRPPKNVNSEPKIFQEPENEDLQPPESLFQEARDTEIKPEIKIETEAKANANEDKELTSENETREENQ